ncbi:hypothetical protein C8Q78DRAFT_1009718 [Trametes maxima]|nr:hypothetical protein C8Q78DRAFT_1009718 [Trametes maxima]
MAGSSSSVLKGQWRPTKIMNMHDLSRDDDFLSHLLVEKLGTGDVPLVVHKMDPSRRLPKTDADHLLQIVRRLVSAKGPPQTAIRQAVDDLLSLTAVRYYIRSYNQKQINAFATHASRYFELYLPSGSIEIAHTSRYSHHTGKSELCILATRPLAPGMVVSELKGSMADLTEEEDKELKGTDAGQADGAGIRRDFSVIHSKQLKKNHLFLGPARFVNHDCDHNVELFREGRYITFRVIRRIGVGEEVTAHYGDGYFGRNNRHCLCETCERNARGGYAPHNDDEVSDSGSSPGGADSDNDESDWTTDREDSAPQASVNVNERRTRRGVYVVLPDEEQDAGDGTDAELDAEPEPDRSSDLTSLPISSSSGPAGPSKLTGLLTPDSETLPAESCPPSAVSTPRKATPTTSFIISTRAQKARAASELESISAVGKGKAPETSRSASAVRQLETPPLTSENGSVAEGPSRRSSSRLRTRGDAASSASRLSTPMHDVKGKASAHSSTADAVDLKGKGREDPELEGRTLRKRAFVPSAVDAQSASAKKPGDGPRGVDGKPLPTCVTCKNVLPVISVDHEVVWGLALGRTGKRGRPRKNANIECPRCMRHFAIYAVKWPSRLPTDGTHAFVPTPRDNRSITPAHTATRISHTALATLNHKLSHAASASASRSASASVPHNPYKRQRTVEEHDEAPSLKRQKLPSPRKRGRPPKNKVGMSTKAKELLGVNERRSERNRRPSLKLRESESPPKLQPDPTSPSGPKAPDSTTSTSTSTTSSTASNSSLTAEDPSSPKGANSLPLSPTTPVVVKREGPKLPTPKSLAVAAQPREANGRFGKKESTNGRYMRKNFHFTAGGRRLHRGRKKPAPKAPEATVKVEGEGTTTAPNAETSAVSDPSSSPSQKRSHDEAEGMDDEPVKRPKLEVDEDAQVRVEVKIEGEEGDLSAGSSEDTSQEEEEEQLFLRPRLNTSKSGVGLLSRPNPLTFARRKWTSVPPEDPPEISNTTSSCGPHSSTDDDADLPVTPQDDVEHPVATVDELRVGDLEDEYDDYDDYDDYENEASDEDSQERLMLRPALTMKPRFAGAMTWKPSPFNMARRRWGTSAGTSTNTSIAVPSETETERSADRPNAPSGSTAPSFTDLFEADGDPEEASVAAGDESARGSIDPDVSSEEEGFRGPSMMSILKPGRRSSSASSALVELTDDSEQMVERLVAVPDPLTSSSESRPTTASSAPIPSPSQQKSPGMAWKQTVLLPMNIPFLHTVDTHTTATVTLSADISPAPTKLMRAGWDSGSSDETD